MAKPRQYKFCFGPWNLSEGQDPYGPTTRAPQTFDWKLEQLKNLGFDAMAYVGALPRASVGEIHVSGHARNDADGRTILIDDHGSRVSPGVWQLYTHALSRFGPVATLVEWDTDIPRLDTLLCVRKTTGMAAQVGRPMSGADALIPAAWAASSSIISCRALPRTMTTSGACAASASGP